MKSKIDDSLNVTIDIKWLVQLVIIIGSCLAAYYNIRMDIKSVEAELEEIRTTTELQLNDIQSRLEVLEQARTAQLEEMNKSMFKKMFGKDE